MTLQPLSAPQALNAFYLDARGRLLDLAATLDRIERGSAAESAHADPRFHLLQQAVRLLADGEPARAERLQQLFSLSYDPAWPRPEPR
jgi:hypothetical protein